MNYLFIVKHQGPHVWALEVQGCARQGSPLPSTGADIPVWKARHRE